MRRRTVLFAFTLLTGLILAILGVTLSAPIGPVESPVYSNPRVDFAPLMFVVGVTFLFGSAVVYEIAPDEWDE